MIFEKKREPLITRNAFIQRVINNALIAAGSLLLSCLIGILGYHFLENLSWIDALLNASMILGGMGPVDKIQTLGGKCFASFYAIFSGVVFLGIFAIIIAPIYHRFLHRFHVE